MKSSGDLKQIFLYVATIAILICIFGASGSTAMAQTVLTSQTPAQIGQTDGSNVNYELGNQFRSTTGGQITAIRFWKDSHESGTHVGHIWSASGSLLATATFMVETTSGWQQQALTTPLTIAANTTYVVTVNTGSTYYVATENGLTSAITNGSLSTTVGNNGLYGAPGKFPTNSWHASNYFRDIVFVAGTSSGGTVAPAITSQPASQSVMAGQSATFRVAATGTSPMSFQWKKNGAMISGATASSYTTPSETISDNNAAFTVSVSNAAGAVTSNSAMLTVNSSTVAPAITSQPASQTVIAGKSATFNVAASGTSPLSYQWSKNGAAISGATSASYTTPAETTADNNAKFAVVVSNGAGSATSSSATLIVSASSLILNSSVNSVTFGNVTVATASTKTVTFTNAGNSAVTISGVSVSGAGFTATGVSNGLILNAGQTASMTVTFSPSSAVSVTGAVSVASNASNSPDSVSLAGTGVAAVNHSVALSWIASTSTVKGYNTYSSTVSGGPYTKLNSSTDTVTSYTDSTVQSGKTYFYVVTSLDSNNVESGYSSQVSATIP